MVGFKGHCHKTALKCVHANTCGNTHGNTSTQMHSPKLGQHIIFLLGPSKGAMQTVRGSMPCILCRSASYT